MESCFVDIFLAISCLSSFIGRLVVRNEPHMMSMWSTRVTAFAPLFEIYTIAKF